MTGLTLVFSQLRFLLSTRTVNSGRVDNIGNPLSREKQRAMLSPIDEEKALFFVIILISAWER